MLDRAPSRVVTAGLAGPVAARALREGAAGSVAAVFDRSFYASLGGMLVCVGPHGLGAGPLNLLYQPSVCLGDDLRAGDPAGVVDGVLRAPTVHIDLRSAVPWQPNPPGTWSQSSLRCGLAALAAVLPAALPQQGLAQLLRPAETRVSSPVLAAALAPVRYLDDTIGQWLAGAEANLEAAQVAPLVGLGPGLTPSGDDYIGGLLLALALTGRTEIRDRLWQALEPALAAGTGDISRAHLGAAAQGYGSAALHELLNGMLEGQSEAIASALAAVAAIGHTSGWDALAGAMSVLQRARG